METRRIEVFLLLMFLVQVTWAKDILPVLTSPKPFPSVDMPYISSGKMDNAFRQAQTDANSRSTLEGKLSSNGGIIPAGSNSAIARHQRFTAIDSESMRIDESQSTFEQASKNLVSQFNLKHDQAAFGLGQLDLPHGSSRAQSAMQECQKHFNTGQCNPNFKFRKADGSCNNLDNPLWGKSFTCFERLVPPDYADGLSAPRLALSGNPLPNPRIVSRIIHNDLNIPSREYTLMTMQWGQFMDHDLTLTPMTRAGRNMDMIECCPLDNGQQKHPECFPIELPPDDDFFGPLGETCLNFVRSATCNADCKLGPRQQTNQLTGQIDASNVYGSDDNDTRALRKFNGGLMKAQYLNAGELLPRSSNPNNDQCSRPQQNAFCFQAGDERVNEQPGLTSMHTIWLRQHNRIAEYLGSLYPKASDEDIFQETRRIVAAQLQVITYNEFLPVVLGPDYMNYFKLYPNPVGGDYTTYQPDTQLSIVTEFSTAAYRFGHTLIQNTFEEVDTSDRTVKGLDLQDNFFFPFTLFNGELDPIIRGLFARSAQQFDRNVVEAVTNHLYKPRGDTFGMDLPALNLQRGRDHGINGYTTYINYCFNIQINKFSDLSGFMSNKNWQKLAELYENVQDIDLFTGGVSEDPLTGAVVGPTFGCIIGLQFNHLKFGDRFYFEHGGEGQRQTAVQFTPDQLDTIRKTTLAKVLCANADSIDKIAYNVFLPTAPRSYSRCSNIPELNLDYW